MGNEYFRTRGGLQLTKSPPPESAISAAATQQSMPFIWRSATRYSVAGFETEISGSPKSSDSRTGGDTNTNSPRPRLRSFSTFAQSAIESRFGKIHVDVAASILCPPKRSQRRVSRVTCKTFFTQHGCIIRRRQPPPAIDAAVPSARLRALDIRFKKVRLDYSSIAFKMSNPAVDTSCAFAERFFDENLRPY